MKDIINKIDGLLCEAFYKSFDILNRHITVFSTRAGDQYYFDFRDERYFFDKKPTEKDIKSILKPIFDKEDKEKFDYETSYIKKMEKKYSDFDFIEQLIIRKFKMGTISANVLQDAVNIVINDYEIWNRYKSVKVNNKIILDKIIKLIDNHYLQLENGKFGLTDKAIKTKFVKDLHKGIIKFLN